MHIGVVGAGIIGISAAVVMAARGHEVPVYDRTGIASGASGGHAGAFAFADVIPLATPGITRKALGWLVDPNGPMAIPLAYAIRIVPWLPRFWRASLPDRYRTAVETQGALMRLSSDALDRMVARYRLSRLIRCKGQLQLNEGDRQFRASLEGWVERRAVGVEFSFLKGPGAITEIQPGIASGFTHAAFTSRWQNVIDPALCTRRLADEAREMVAVLGLAEISALQPQSDGFCVEANGASVRFDRVVPAAGAHSRTLLKPLSLSLPLESERGYNVTLPAGAFDLRIHVTFSNHDIVVSRIGKGKRVGGGVELGGHGTIGTVTMAIEKGLIKPREPGRLSFDAPAGTVDITYRQKGRFVEEVRLINVPSFLHSKGLAAEIEGLGEVVADVAYDGIFYAIIEPQKRFEDMAQFTAVELIGLSQKLRAALNTKYQFLHPEHPQVNGLNHIPWTGRPTQSEAHAHNAVFFGDKAIDRSPCGTVTSARMAQLVANGRLAVGDRHATIPSIGGWARQTGFNTIFIDDRDPLRPRFHRYLISTRKEFLVVWIRTLERPSS